MTDEIIRMTGQSADFPLLTAFLLGLIAALNPCQLAINVSAFTWLFSRSSAPGNTLKTGLLYLLGRFAAFFAMGWGCTLAFSYFDLQMSALSERFANIFLWVERLLPFAAALVVPREDVAARPDVLPDERLCLVDALRLRQRL